MKRYMLFEYETHYPSGGMHDFIFDFDAREELEVRFREEYGDEHRSGVFSNYQYIQIYDTKEEFIIYDDNFEEVSEEWGSDYYTKLEDALTHLLIKTEF